MKKRQLWYVLTLLLFLSFRLYGSDNLRLPDIRTIALGNNGATETALYNPSLIALAENKLVGINYFNRYHLKELGTVTGELLFPNTFLPLALSVSSFGYDAYRENRLRIAVGKKLDERWSLGVAIHYSFLQTELFDESVSRLATDVGITFQMVENLLIGASVMNTPSVRMGNKEAEPACFTGYNIRVGFQWKVFNNLLIVMDTGSSEEHTLSASAGMEYTLFETFHIRSGVQTNPLVPSLGVGYQFTSFSLDVGTVYHPVLALSTGVGISFSF